MNVERKDGPNNVWRMHERAFLSYEVRSMTLCIPEDFPAFVTYYTSKKSHNKKDNVRIFAETRENGRQVAVQKKTPESFR